MALVVTKTKAKPRNNKKFVDPATGAMLAMAAAPLIEKVVGGLLGAHVRAAVPQGGKAVIVPGKAKRKKSKSKSNSSSVQTLMNGGQKAQSASIPGNYPSAPVKMGVEVVKKTKDGQVLRIVDQLAICDLTQAMNSGSPTYASAISGLSLVQINPESSSVLPNYFVEMEMWQKWRPLEIGVHYRQACPSTTQGMLHLGFSDSQSGNEQSTELGTSAQVIDALEGTVSGSVNQDLSARWKPESWNPSSGGAPFYDLGAGDSTVWGLSDISCGALGLYADLTAGSATAASPAKTGRFYIELVLEVSQSRAPYTGSVGFGALARAARKENLTEDQKAAIRAAWLQKVKHLYSDIVLQMDKPTEKRHPVEGLTPKEFESGIAELSRHFTGAGPVRGRC